MKIEELMRHQENVRKRENENISGLNLFKLLKYNAWAQVGESVRFEIVVPNFFLSFFTLKYHS